MSKQALNCLLGQLERLGYLQRRDPRDQRFKRIALTARGRRAAQAMRDIVHDVEREWEHKLGPERLPPSCAFGGGAGGGHAGGCGGNADRETTTTGATTGTGRPDRRGCRRAVAIRSERRA